MAEPQRITIDRLESMSVAERAALRSERTITDLSAVDPEFLELARADARKALDRHSAKSRRNG